MLSIKNLLKILINTVIGIVLILVWLYFVDLNELIKTLKNANYFFIPLFFASFTLAIFLRSLRLKLLLDTQTKIPLKNLFFLILLGQFLSFTIPIRAGEIAKSIYLSSKYDINIGKSVLWIFIDRFLDFWVIMLLISILLLVIPTNLPQNFSLILLAVFFAFTVAAILILATTKFAKNLAEILSRFLYFPKLRITFLTFSHNIIEAFEILKLPPVYLLKIMLITLLASLADGLIWYITFASFKTDFTALRTYLGSLLSSLTYLIPAAPGYVGSAEASGFAVFSLALGMDKNLASAATVLNHMLTVVFILGAGIIAIYNLDFNVSSVIKKILRKE